MNVHPLTPESPRILENPQPSLGKKINALRGAIYAKQHKKAGVLLQELVNDAHQLTPDQLYYSFQRATRFGLSNVVKALVPREKEVFPQKYHTWDVAQICEKISVEVVQFMLQEKRFSANQGLLSAVKTNRPAILQTLFNDQSLEPYNKLYHDMLMGCSRSQKVKDVLLTHWEKTSKP